MIFYEKEIDIADPPNNEIRLVGAASPIVIGVSFVMFSVNIILR